MSSSSSGNRAMVAVTRGSSVGVDVERLTSPFPLPVDDGRIFSNQELRALQSGAPAQVDELGYRIWVRKEAVAKCLGLGLVAHLPRLDCERQGRRWVTTVPGPPAVAYLDLDAEEGYVAALASSTWPIQVVPIEWEAIAPTKW